MRTVLAGLALALVLAAPAAAQEPIAGGGSFNDAPVLGSGRYMDTLRGAEQLFYAVELKRGQMVTAEATISGRTDGGYTTRLQLYNAQRKDDVFDGADSQSFGPSEKSVSLRVVGQRVGEDDGGISDSTYAEPGTYYIGVLADDSGENLDPVQFETEINIQVTGDIVEEPAPSATPAGEEATPVPEAGETAGLGGSGGAGSGGGELGMAIVLGLALGGMVGFGARRLRAG